MRWNVSVYLAPLAPSLSRLVDFMQVLSDQRHQPFAQPFGLLRFLASSRSLTSICILTTGRYWHHALLGLLHHALAREAQCGASRQHLPLRDAHIHINLAHSSLLDTPTEIKAINLVSLRKAKARGVMIRPTRILQATQIDPTGAWHSQLNNATLTPSNSKGNFKDCGLLRIRLG